jgi:8-oxo-dGTP pyrophosphatase MutT (NUDIX family)
MSTGLPSIVTEKPWVRPAARVVVLDPDGRVLLFGSRGPDPVPGSAVLFWYTPGGGLEDGENLRDAAARELAEETGLVVAPHALEGPVWLRRHIWPWGDRIIDSRETFFAVRDVVHEVAPTALTEWEVFADEPHRWWSAAEIDASDEAFVPADLAERLRELAAGPFSGPPLIVS